MWYEWITSVYLVRRCTGRLRTCGVYERSGSSAYKLEEHSQQGLVEDVNHLGGSGGGSSRQIRMASECGPMHPLGCRLKVKASFTTWQLNYRPTYTGRTVCVISKVHFSSSWFNWCIIYYSSSHRWWSGFTIPEYFFNFCILRCVLVINDNRSIHQQDLKWRPLQYDCTTQPD